MRQRINVPASASCQKCHTSQQDAFGGFILPSQDRDEFDKLTSYYTKQDADAKKRKQDHKFAKRAALAKARASDDNAWVCKKCVEKGPEAKMSLTTDCCFRCAGKRPIELKAKAIAFQNSAEGKAAARKKAGKCRVKEMERGRVDRLQPGSAGPDGQR